MEQTLARTAEIIRRDDSFIDGCVRKILCSPHIQKTQNGNFFFRFVFFVSS